MLKGSTSISEDEESESSHGYGSWMEGTMRVKVTSHLSLRGGHLSVCCVYSCNHLAGHLGGHLGGCIVILSTFYWSP